MSEIGFTTPMSLDDDYKEQIYKIVAKCGTDPCSEKKYYPLTKRQLSLSNFLNNCIINEIFRAGPFGKIKNDLEFEVDINSFMMDLISEYLVHHDGNDITQIDKPISSLNMSEVKTEDNKMLDSWDVEFVNKLKLKELLKLIEAANYMDIKGLLDLCCAKLATIIKVEKIEDVEKLFNNLN